MAKVSSNYRVVLRIRVLNNVYQIQASREFLEPDQIVRVTVELVLWCHNQDQFYFFPFLTETYRIKAGRGLLPFRFTDLHYQPPQSPSWNYPGVINWKSHDLVIRSDNLEKRLNVLKKNYNKLKQDLLVILQFWLYNQKVV